MHMADALISPLVGGAMWGISTGTIGYSVKKLQHEIDHKKIPLMGVMGAFVFAAQMINFSIPLTGSSGHLGGGILLAILLGPYAGFVTLTSVLIIQALFLLLMKSRRDSIFEIRVLDELSYKKTFVSV